jgi:protocatechuate 3,4-dioxygenase beta subunit
MLNRVIVSIVPIAVVLILGSVLWQYDGMENSDHPCSLTEENAEGPYYVVGAPQKEKLGEFLDGQRLIISGNILDYNCNPVPNAIVDVWQTDSKGEYHFEDFTLRGTIHANEDGFYTMDTIFPGKYSEAGQLRPAHLHLKVSSPEGQALTTQLYFAGDEHHDWLTRPSLILELNEMDGIKYAEFDFTIMP